MNRARVYAAIFLLLMLPSYSFAMDGAPSFGGVSPEKPDCDALVSNKLFDATQSNFKILDNAECKAYRDLITKYRPPSGMCTPRDATGITELNAQFAEDLDQFLQVAPPGIYIYSAYRPAVCDPESYGGNANLNPHARGVAADLVYPDAVGSSKTVCDLGHTPSPDYLAVSRISMANTFKVRLYGQDGHGALPGECNHVEDSSGIIGKTGGGGVICANAGGGCNPSYQNPYPYPSDSNSSGGKYSANYGLGGLFGGSGGSGSMMQLMLGMQLGQMLGNMFQSTRNSSSGTTQTTSSSDTNQSTNNTGSTNTGGGEGGSHTSNGSSPIDLLLQQLNGATTSPTQINNPPQVATTATSSVSVNPNDVGNLESTTSFPESTFVQPTSGIAPLSVTAHFETGTACSDAFDLSWGDGSAHETMTHQSPSNGNACPMLAQVHDIAHTFSSPGTYQISLWRGAALTALSTTTVTVTATSTDASHDVLGNVSVQLNNASSALLEASSTGDNSAFNYALTTLQHALSLLTQLLFHLIAP